MSIVILDTGTLKRWEPETDCLSRDANGAVVSWQDLETNVDLADLARRINIEISLREDGYKGVYASDIVTAMRKLEP